MPISFFIAGCLSFFSIKPRRPKTERFDGSGLQRFAWGGGAYRRPAVSTGKLFIIIRKVSSKPSIFQDSRPALCGRHLGGDAGGNTNGGNFYPDSGNFGCCGFVRSYEFRRIINAYDFPLSGHVIAAGIMLCLFKIRPGVFLGKDTDYFLPANCKKPGEKNRQEF